MESFKYDAIDLEGPTFRLIRLFKGDNDLIQCHLFDAWLHQKENLIDYAALSYTWGEAEKPYEIIVNGSILAVTRNLHLALQHLRYQNQDRILWIDAICIDQDNHRERGHQVQQMTSIYKEAERVIIWLGASSSVTDFTMDFMKELEIESLKYSCYNWKISDRGWRDIWSTIEARYSSDLMQQQREGVNSLLARSWFKRVWILQEVANARAAEIVCGTKSVSSRIFALTPSLAGIIPDHHCQAVLDIMPGPSRKSSWWTQKRDLQTLLTKFGNSEASDPRDIIYALLGISSDCSKSDHLKADYEKSLQEVIQDTTLFILHFPTSDYPIQDFPKWKLQEFLGMVNQLSNAFLGLAVHFGNEAVVKLLIHHSSINIYDNDISVLLSVAAARGDQVILHILIESGATIDKMDNHGDTALCNAFLKGFEGVARMLIKGGANINAKNDSKGETALHQAAHNGNLKAAKLLIDNGADVNSRNKEEETALHWAVHKGSREIARLLIDKGTDINLRDNKGRTVLHHAAQYWSQVIARLLVDNGAYTNLRDDEGETALDIAVRLGQEWDFYRKN